ncbi:hypothetical protein [Pontimicrobium aquaticum]|uniref:DUF4488 domain-containing protein n=1 Tax=Pontimicrobium aquaticum TaxID=2565367 RepID=A0A4V5LQ53_9FLAO|nr:hypothetical protein [Pontimicrobium aquaticum]TJY33939.1 hypothetical protein E5167_11485 [Pontimicrobium aquaticum]
MKKLILLLLIIPLTSFNYNQATDFVGRWTGEDKNEIGFITFDKEGYASFEFEGKIFGGKEFVINGEKGKMVYVINKKVTPIQVDFVVKKLETGEERKILCIAKFEDENNMQFAMTFDSVCPTEFNSENSITLKRVE